ncbi:hypothetical protein O181_059340 [Austropuccinia psidii MF-1]|uniref:MARVEL domain-containing protein n=1 Tax=Austropuccinia psidii MF-1 TaxID=1389203 RepID=A0A9Q3HYN3_9BASI|nr:hypothetical protein [Austropuccinia psidii MF-1]
MSIAKFVHTSIFSLVMIGCVAEIITSGILVGGYNKGEDPPTSSLGTRVRYLLFCGIWTFIFSLAYLIGIMILADHLIFSTVAHLIWLSITIILFVSGSAALTYEIRDQDFPHQGRLEILEGFAWADSILLGLALLLIFGIGIGRRNGLTGNFLGGP